MQQADTSQQESADTDLTGKASAEEAPLHTVKYPNSLRDNIHQCICMAMSKCNHGHMQVQQADASQPGGADTDLNGEATAKDVPPYTFKCANSLENNEHPCICMIASYAVFIICRCNRQTSVGQKIQIQI